jgi:pimeloyl-ACP methyl ester carboxylesterase
MTLHLSWARTGSRGGEPLVLLHGIGSTKADFTTVRPLLEEHFEVLAPDLPGHGSSPRLPGRATVSRLADVLEADLDEMQIDRVHVLGNSLGGRLALELAARGRALSVVAISPSGLNVPIERIYQGSGMVLSRVVLRRLHRLIEPAARSPLGRTFLLTGLRGAPWRASEAEAAALKDGFAGAEGFWNMLWWALLVDVPTGLRRISVPVLLAQGTADVIASGQTPRYLLLVPGSSFTPLWGAGHAPQSDTPEVIALLVRRTAAAAGEHGQRRS